MKVYVEWVFLDNFAMDCFLLYLAVETLRIKARWYRIVLGGVVGSVTAILTVTLWGVWLYLAKFLSLLLMSIATVGFGKKLFWHILLTLAYTFVLGGAIIGIFNLTATDFTSGIVYQSDLPIFAYVLGIFAVIVLSKCITAYVKSVKTIAPNLVKVTVVIDKPVCVTALWDSGNCATHNGLPVCFVSKKFSKIFAEKLLKKQTEKVEITTVAGRHFVVATKGQIVAFKQTYDVYFAIAKTTSLYDVILSNQILQVAMENANEKTKTHKKGETGNETF